MTHKQETLSTYEAIENICHGKNLVLYFNHGSAFPGQLFNGNLRGNHSW